MKFLGPISCLVAGNSGYIVHLRMPQGTPLAVAIIAASVLLLVLLVVVLEIFRRKRELDQKVAIQWEAFDITARQKGLTEEEMELLRDIHSCQSGEVSPDSVLRLASVYDRAIDDWMAALSEDGERPSVAQWEHLARIRSCLGFNSLSFETRLSHTRQFPLLQTIRIWTTKGDKVARAMVVANHETELELDWAEAPIELALGESVNISFSRQSDGEYRCEVPVISIRDGGFCVAHTARLNRQQLRMWVRVPVALVGRAFRLVAPDGQALPVDELEIRLLDLSGGGAMIASPMAIPVETRGLMSFELGDVQLVDVPFLLLRHGKSTKEGWQIGHLCFDGIDTASQEKVMRFVFEKQRTGQAKSS
jgi:c-di-GMP-binding flagellar brake protein YcgR